MNDPAGSGRTPEGARVADQLRRAYDGDAWHGPSLVQILQGIDAAQAAATPLPGARSIWETLLHVTAWTDEIRERIRGKTPGEPEAGDWPPVGPRTDRAWQDAQARLRASIEQLEQAMQSFPDARLEETVGPPARDQAQGTGVDTYTILHGQVQHLVYHTAQIASFRRALRGGR
jgi:uncharacterized damage-inducible protein DinB